MHPVKQSASSLETRESRGPRAPRAPTRLSALFAIDPRATEEFFRSVRGAFQKNEDNAGTTLYGLLALVAAALVLTLVWPTVQRRRLARSQRRALRRLVSEQCLSEDDVELLETLADHAGTHPLIVGTHIDVFERATAAELRGLRPSLPVREGTMHARLRHLRTHLSFAAHTDHDALLTTRELLPGYTVEIRGARTTVTEVTEAYFAIVLGDERLAVADVGVKVPLTILHDREASYSVASPLLGIEPSASGFTLFFAHDEAPARQQQRQFVRVRAVGPAQLVVIAERGGKQRAAPISGALLDVSLQGVAVSVREKVAARTQARLSFSFRDELFRNIDVIALECEGPPAGPFRLRVHFRDLSRADERRLGAAVAHATTRRSTLPSAART
ncbi:MAG TPA: PilZ domain-containing protein [Polyangiaceae bacterium]